MPYYADQKGFFKAAGLDVTLQIFPNGGSVTQGLAGGAIDVGVTNSGSMSLAHLRGLPITLLACGALYSPSAPIAHIVAGKSSGIRTAKDLSGKTLSVSTLRDMIQASAMAWIDRNGGDSKSVNFVEVPMVEMTQAMTVKRIDGGLLVEPIFTRSKPDVIDLGTPYQSVANSKPFQTLGIVANKDWVEKNPGAAKKVATVLHQSASWANKNHGEAATLLAQLTKIPFDVIASIPRLAFAESNNPAFVQPVIELLVRYGIMSKSFPAAELFAPGLT